MIFDFLIELLMRQYIWNRLDCEYVREAYSKYSRLIRSYKESVDYSVTVGRGCFYFYLVEKFPKENDLIDSWRFFGEQISLSTYYRAKRFVRTVNTWKESIH